MTFQQVLQKYREFSFSERDKGGRFERLMQAFLQTVPWYAGKFRHVWLWKEFPCKSHIGGKDTGIDLVAQTVDGDYWAIQCKCYDEKAAINKPAVDSFLATSSKQFVNDKGETDSFAQRLWISTTNRWGSEAEHAIANQDPPVTRIGLTQLNEAPVDWEALEKGVHGAKALQAKKSPMPHQDKAIEEFHQHFKTDERGKLIMACGTGKTFTSLKIAEKETGGNGLVLFLAPSIALIGQTLREWTAQADKPIFPICICSDPEVSKSKSNDDDIDGSRVVDLAFPASTKVPEILRQLRLAEKYHSNGLTVVFSTYQSIDVISKAQKKFGHEFDLIICDEAHRTTGVTLKGEDESAFVKVHDNKFIKAKRRVYMTATPRLYHPNAKDKAEKNDAVVCSMDDPALYGKEVYRLGFGEAVDKSLLSDYKVLVLTLGQSDIPEDMQIAVADKDRLISMDDASKLVGCINALSKRMLIDQGNLKITDPEPMRKAVAFCQSIKKSKIIKEVFNDFKDQYYDSLPLSEREDVVRIQSKHIDGTMGASIRSDLINWLNSSPSEGNECRILNNVRCLSEGVDVPSLDAVLFLSARDSHIDVVQSVGRVMRKAPNKKFGYIIIPVLIPENETPDEILKDDDRFKVVWNVLTALRAHDDRFDATIKKIELNRHKPTGGGSLIPGRIPRKKKGNGTDTTGGGTKPDPILFPFTQIKSLQNAIYARMVQKVGNKRYWEQWASNVAEIAQGYMERINRLITKPGPHKEAFDKFLHDLQKNINPAVTSGEVVEMLAQHYITKPVFEALFENYSFVKENPISQALQEMLNLLEEQALEKDTITLSRFYDSVKRSVSNIDNAPARQKIITELYDKFFRIAFPLTVERLGIVYTPVEIVDYINNSVADILKNTFGHSISDEEINILDPFTGTGTFIARLIESGLIDKKDLERKYENELFANEIILLAYYIASINIENAYHTAMGEEIPYKPFNGICLTDTFQLGEKEEQGNLLTPLLKKNSERVEREQKKRIQIIVGNPPYSIGQRSANDNAQNQKYPSLEIRISETYAQKSSSNNKKALYDSYIKAFRWASDRIDRKLGGIIAFVCNAGWLEGNATDGFRKYLVDEFSTIFIYNLRGNCRTSGEQRKKEKGNVFGLGSRTPICITILVKNPVQLDKATIYYHDIGDYLTKDDKLKIIDKSKSVLFDMMQWEILTPDKNGDWINKGNDNFYDFIPMGNKNKDNTIFNDFYCLGLTTNRDAWCYNYSFDKLKNNIDKSISYFNSLSSSNLCIEDKIKVDSKYISLSRQLKKDMVLRKQKNFSESNIYTSFYRPFNLQYVYFSSDFNEYTYKFPNIFPNKDTDNLIICVSGIGGSKINSVFISNKIVDLNFLDAGSQCFPLYYYEKRSTMSPTLFDSVKTNEYKRHYAITDFIINRCKDSYGERVTKEDIFYYVYGLLHSSEYRTTFASDLKKSLPRLPLVDKPTDFWSFSKAGRDLAAIHLEYENQPAPADIIVDGAENGNFIVQKMSYPDKNDKSIIRYNEYILVKNIPLAAYEYVVNGRSAIEWIIERYQVKTDKASGITNDPNDWAKEHGKPRYILDLLLSIITVSIKTCDIIAKLPKLTF